LKQISLKGDVNYCHNNKLPIFYEYLLRKSTLKLQKTLQICKTLQIPTLYSILKLLTPLSLVTKERVKAKTGNIRLSKKLKKNYLFNNQLNLHGKIAQ